MSITFREFVELIEGKKKDLKRLKSAYMAGQELQPSPVLNIPAGEPNSPERAAAIKKLMRASGGGAVRSAIKNRENKAEKVSKNILKQQQEGFSSKSFQQELEKKRKKEAEEKETQRKQRSSDLYNERTRGRGVRARSKGKEGWIKDGKFTPDEDT
jgi:hypothetical protein